MTVYVDPLFPFTPPAFLYCYSLIINRISQGVRDTDDQGWPITSTATTEVVKGYVSAPDTRELTPAGEATDCVVRVPNGTVVDHADTITVVSGQALPPQLIGTFRVTQVRPNQADTRVLCTRVTDPDGAER